MIRLIRGWALKWAGRKRPVRLTDLKGNPITVPRDLVEDLIVADVFDEAALLNDDKLVWQYNVVWTMNVAGLRNVIRMAQECGDDEELALLTIVANFHWQD